VRFTPDARAIAYVVKDGSADASWLSSLEGTALRTLASFGAGHVSAFDWSPDGATIVALRQYGDSDVVLLSDTSR
jgi:Tol biopolymer transport system component